MDYHRRQLLTKSGLILAAGFGLTYCPLSFANQLFINESELAFFSKLSTAITGQTDLSQALITLYYQKLLTQPEYKDFLALMKAAKDGELSSALTQSYTQALKQKLIEMWYLGVLNDKTISIAGYQQGLAWKMIGSTAPGFCLGDKWQSPP